MKDAARTGRNVPWRVALSVSLLASLCVSTAFAGDRQTSSSSPFLSGGWFGNEPDSRFLPGYATYSDALESTGEETIPPDALMRVGVVSQHDPEESVGPMNVGRFSLTSTEEAPNDPVATDDEPGTPAAPLTDSPNRKS